MGLLNKITRLRKNRQFDYNPRFYDDKGKGNPYKLEHKFDEFRTTVGSNRGLKNKINKAIQDSKSKGDRDLKIRMAIILAILIFGFLYIIDFDLSIFIGN